MRTVSALLIIAIGCGGSSGKTVGDAKPLDAATDAPLDAHVVLVDAPPDAPEVCNVLTQAGCSASEKCTWIVDTASTGHIGCAPNGAKANGAACTRNSPGANGYDDCSRGDYCYGPDTGGAGICKQICDQAGGAPMCGSSFGCTTYDGLFGPSGQVVAAGVCEPTCNPLADNNFLGSNGNNRTGNACGSAGMGSLYAEGCYGFPYPPAGPTKFVCNRQYNYSRVHRMQCDPIQHPGDLATCAADAQHVYINGCAEGYMPLFVDAEGSTQTDCMAFCQPASCYNTGSGTTAGSSSCGTGSAANISGTAPYQCATSRLQFASFNQVDPTSIWSTATPTVNNGEQCYYSWLFEIDSTSGMLTGSSATSDTVGWCVDHSQYKYDPSGGANNSTVWPRCDGIGIGSNGYNVGGAGPDAVGFGCVDSATARAAGEISFTGKVVIRRPEPLLRGPYHATARR